MIKLYTLQQSFEQSLDTQPAFMFISTSMPILTRSKWDLKGWIFLQYMDESLLELSILTFPSFGHVNFRIISNSTLGFQICCRDPALFF